MAEQLAREIIRNDAEYKGNRIDEETLIIILDNSKGENKNKHFLALSKVPKISLENLNSNQIFIAKVVRIHKLCANGLP